MADSTPAEEVERILMEALGMVEKVAWDFFREGWVEDLRNKILWVGLEVVVELMGKEDRVGEGGGGGGGYSGGGSGGNTRHSCGGGGGSYNSGKSQHNECCYNEFGHGKVTIILL